LASGSRILELTYVVDTAGRLWVSDRHSEHVACARGGAVLGAGELILRITRDDISIDSVSNQSTGYCPEPDCWPAVRQALLDAGLRVPSAFTHAFEFRRCVSCATINVLKDGMPDCPNCDTELPSAWNLDAN
jgi:hypothetical protein